MAEKIFTGFTKKKKGIKVKREIMPGRRSCIDFVERQTMLDLQDQVVQSN